jgi:ferredoxin
MPTLTLEVPGATALEVSVLEGGRLLDVCDRIGASVAFSCRSADCGSCLVEAIDGADELFPPSPREATTLRVLSAAPGQRLACQALMRPGAARLRLRALLPPLVIRSEAKDPTPNS